MTVTGITIGTVAVAPGILVSVTIASVPLPILLVNTVPAPIDTDSLVDCETENVCSVLGANDVKVGLPVQTSPIALV